MIKLVSIVLAGGCSRRLYPIASALRPKQFLPGYKSKYLFNESTDLAGEISDQTILISAIRYRNNILLPLNQEQRGEVQFIFEPCMRNTLAAVALGAVVVIDKFNDPLVMVMPGDLVYQDKKEVKTAISELTKKYNDNVVTFISDIEATKNPDFFGPFICRASKLLALCKSVNEANFSQLIRSLKNSYVRQNETNISYEDYSSVAEIELRKEIFQGKLNISNHIISSKINDINTVEDFYSLYQKSGEVRLEDDLKNIDIKSFNQFSPDYYIAKENDECLLRRKSAKQAEIEVA